MTNMRRNVRLVREQRVATAMKLEHSRRKYCADGSGVIIDWISDAYQGSAHRHDGGLFGARGKMSFS